MSYDSDTVSVRGPALLSEAHRLLWIRTGCFDGRIGDGNRQRTCRVPDAGIVPSAQADGKVRQLAGGTRAASLTHRCMAVGSLGRPPRRLATRTVGSRLPSRPRPMGTARRPRAVTVHSESCRCREASRVPAWVGSVLRAGPCGELAPIAPAYHRPPSGGGAGTPFRPIRGAARPPQPPDCQCHAG